MPVPEVATALRSVLYFDASAATTPVIVLSGWLVAGLVLMIIGGAVRRSSESRAAKVAVSG